MKIDAIAFDLDGTLIETNDAWHNALNTTLKQYGKTEGITREFFLENHIGVGQKKVISSHINLSEVELEEAVKTFSNIFLSSIDLVKLHDNLFDVLDYISEKTDKMAIITNAYQNVVYAILENLNTRNLDIKKYFKTIVTRDQVKEGKPNPDIIYNACDKLGVKPENMIFIEDSPSGVQAGKNAGCYVIALTSNISEKRLRSAGADRIIKDLLEIKDIITGLSELT